MRSFAVLLFLSLLIVSCADDAGKSGAVGKSSGGPPPPPPQQDEKPDVIVKNFKNMGIDLVCQTDCATEQPKSLQPLHHHRAVFKNITSRLNRILLQATASYVLYDSLNKDLSLSLPLTDATVDKFFSTLGNVEQIENNQDLGFEIGFPSDPFDPNVISNALYVIYSRAKSNFRLYKGRISKINFLAGSTGQFANGIWTIDRRQFEDHFDQVWNDLVKQL